MATIAADLTTEICQSLHSQLGALFECVAAGERVQIQTPFLMPDGHQIDVYWRDTPWGQVVSDLGDTYGWLFVNGAYDRLTAKQNAAYDAACAAYGVERLDVAILARVTDGGLADAVIRLAQAITTVSHTLDVGQQPAPAPAESSPNPNTADRITAVIKKHGWPYKRKATLPGRRNLKWQLDFVVQPPQRAVALLALSGHQQRRRQRRAIEHAFTLFSDLAPTLANHPTPIKAISVIDDNDASWNDEPIELLSDVSEVIRLSNPDSLAAAIAG